MAGDMPSLSASNYASAAYGLGTTGGLEQLTSTTATVPAPIFGAHWSELDSAFNQTRNHDERRIRAKTILAVQAIADTAKEMQVTTSTRRLVQVIIADPNENVPLEDCLIYRGDPKLTDLNDQELFFELDIRDLLAKHNEKRITFIDKKVKERVEKLEPAKIRDLKMVVVTIAGF